MKERIIQIMEAENLTPSLFADKLNIGRAVISHILNGRNNPSLDVVIRILDTISYIDADWLLSGKGNMRKSENQPFEKSVITTDPLDQAITSDLFNNASQSGVVENVAQEHSVHTATIKDTVVTTETPVAGQSIASAKQTTLPIFASDKKISKVIIYYSDNTFQAFNPDNTPL